MHRAVSNISASEIDCLKLRASEFSKLWNCCVADVSTVADIKTPQTGTATCYLANFIITNINASWQSQIGETGQSRPRPEHRGGI
mmetsp:Transcript_2684/g.6420  ORF Transcript_2684/g.6420 Transcript_2684/m.6420 type:complete len:85 (+) Transcript_2684:509-763(+)